MKTYGGGAMQEKEPFFPRGAVAFMVFMLAFYALVWGSVYLTLLSRR
ncbi:hypothetical protein [Thermocrinis albus]|nr:hypothetical protein [Thermocrinis albus]